MIIGITGKSGSGKSTLAKLYEENGFTRISVDEIGWEVIEENKDWLKNIYGTSERKQIGEQIFRDRNKYKAFSKSIWFSMEKKIDEKIKNKENIVFDFLLLPHTKYFKMCDKKILLKCNLIKRCYRVLKRDKISLKYFLLREKNSIDFNEEDYDVIMSEFMLKTV